MDEVAEAYKKYSDQLLVKSFKRTVWSLRIALVLVVVCFVAGIWVDWKFLPTMLIPLGASTLFGFQALRASEEIGERAAKKRADEEMFAKLAARDARIAEQTAAYKAEKETLPDG